MNTSPLSLIILEDEAAHVGAILRSFGETDPMIEIRVARCLREYCEQVAARPPDIALLDLNLPDGNEMEALSLLSETNPFPVLIMTSCGSEDVAVAAMKAGALDYLVKSSETFSNMPRAVRRVLREWKLIQAHKKAEEQLRESEMLQKNVLNSLSAHIAVLDKTGMILAVNEPWLNFAQANNNPSADKVGVGSNYLEACRSAQAENDTYATAALAGLQSVLSGKQKRFTLEYPCNSPEASRWFAMEVLQSGGSVAAAIVAHSDITERKLAEEAREAQRMREVRLLGITESAHDAIFRLDAHRVISYWNPAAQRLFGYCKEEALGKTLYQLLVPECCRTAHHERDHALYRIGKAHAIGQSIELATHHKDGHPIAVAISLWTVGIDSDGGTVGSVRDSTNLKRLETEILSVSDREQQRIGQDLHDGLGQQLTALEMKSFILLDDLSAKDLEGSREALKKQVQQISQLLKECIKTTRELSYSLSPVHMEEDGLVNALSQLARRIRVPGKLECQFVCTTPVALDLQTASHLYRIAQEAVNNAVKHAHTPRIDIHFGYDRGILRLQIRDYGQGLPERKGQSPGMGMQGMRHRAAVIGALLEIDSKPGEGVNCSVLFKPNVP